MTPTNLSPAAQIIYNIVRSARVGTSFSEIEGALRFTGHDPAGDLGMFATAWSNVYMWIGINADFIAWMHELTEADLVHFHPTSPLIYAYDGGALPDMPLVTELPPAGGGFDEPHWLPLVVNFGPPAAFDSPMSTTSGDLPHALYRFYSDDEVLLYVGLTMDPSKRWKAHGKEKPWWFDVKNITIERFKSRGDVEIAEIAAIKAERPLYNVQHNRSQQAAP